MSDRLSDRYLPLECSTRYCCQHTWLTWLFITGSRRFPKWISCCFPFFFCCSLWEGNKGFHYSFPIPHCHALLSCLLHAALGHCALASSSFR